jgi:hypothetical protein
MKKLLTFLILLAATLAASAATVSGRIENIIGDARTNTVVLIPRGAPYFIGDTMVGSGPVTLNTDNNGDWSTYLYAGDYSAIYNGRDRINFSVPPGEGSYTVRSLTTSGLTYVYRIPPATSSTLSGMGDVRDADLAAIGQAIVKRSDGLWGPGTVVGGSTNITDSGTNTLIRGGLLADSIVATNGFSAPSITTPIVNGGSLNLSNQIAVAVGGTGRTNLTKDQLLAGDGTNPVQLVTVGSGLSFFSGVLSATAEGGSATNVFGIDVDSFSTNATATAIWTNAMATNYTSRVQVQVTGAGPTNAASYNLDGLFRRGSGNVAKVATNNVSTMESDAGMHAWLAEDTTDQAVKLWVSGLTNEQVHWLAKGWAWALTNHASAPAPGSTIPTPDIMWWPLDAGTGTAITGDATGGADDGTTDASWVAGYRGVGSGYSLEFDGTTDDAYITSMGWTTNIITLSFWLWADVNNDGRTFMELSPNMASYGDTFGAWFEGGYLVGAMRGYAAGVYRIERTATLPSTGAWHHMLYVFNQATNSNVGDVKIYVDAAEQTLSLQYNTKTDASSAFRTDRLNVGARNGNLLLLDGKLDDVRIYSGDRSDLVSDLFSQPSARMTASTRSQVGYSAGLANRAAQLTNTYSGTVATVSVVMEKEASASGVLTGLLYDDNAGSPGNILLTTTNTVANSSLPAAGASNWIAFNFSGASVSNAKWFGISNSVVSGTDYVWWVNDGAFLSGGDKTSSDGTSWLNGQQRGFTYRLFSK